MTALSVSVASLSIVGLAAPAAQAAATKPQCELTGSTFTCTVTYAAVGAEETFVVPDGLTSVDVVAVGAAGGTHSSSTPGRGAVVSADLPVTAGATYYVNVGTPGSLDEAGFNGGGPLGTGAGGGGGATDLRTSSSTSGPSSLTSRLIVAGGGGGADLSASHGGDAGLVGASGVSGTGATGAPGAGGTQLIGGVGGVSGGPDATSGSSGTLGVGGAGGTNYGGGGGGGYYGGGGGGGSTTGVGNGGGGGSSLVPEGGSVVVNSTGRAPQLRISYDSPVSAASDLKLGAASVEAGAANPVQIEVTDGVAKATTTAESLSISPDGAGTGATCSTTSCTATKVGTYTVTGTFAGFTATRDFTVVAGPPATTTLSPDTASTEAGVGQQYQVSGVDAFGNDLGDLTADSTVTLSRAKGAPDECPDALCSSPRVGTWTVTSSTPGAAGPVLDTASLEVTPGPLATLAIAPQDGTTTAGQSVTYSVTGADEYGNAVAVPSPDFTLDSSEGKVACPDGVCTPTTAGKRTVTVTVPGAGDTPVTGSTRLTVLAADAATLHLTPAEATTKAGTPVTYAVGGVDEFGNPLPDQTAASTLTYAPAGGATGPVACDGADCAPTAAGLYTVTASQQGDAAPAPATAVLEVVAGGLDETTLTPGDLVTQAGVQAMYTVSGVDQHGNSLGDLTSSSDVTAALPGGAEVDCPRGVCLLEKAGTYTVTATTPVAGGGSVTSTATLDVVAAALDRVALTPGAVTVTVGEPVTYAVTGKDRFGNSLGDQAQDATIDRTRTSGGSTERCSDATCTVATAGTYRVTATVGGVSDTATLVAKASDASVDVAPVGDLTFGDDVPVSATVSSPDGVPSGLVQFSLDGDPLGGPVELGKGGTATRPAVSGEHAGLHTLTADFVSEPDGAYTLASEARPFVVAKAPTSTDVKVTADSVAATVDGVGDLGGSVRFSLDGRPLGSAPLVDGVATFDGDTRTDRDSVVAATYVGDTDHEGSTGSTVREDPSITAELSGDPHEGWHAGPVTATFTCTAGSGAVECPDPVVLDTEGADQYVTQTVTAADGGVAMVTAGPVNIDLTAPAAGVRGSRDGRVHWGRVPRTICVGTDSLSGVASCEVSTTGSFPGSFTTTSTVTDLAGNVSTRSVTYEVRGTWFSGRTAYADNAWKLRRGRTKTLHLVGLERPRVMSSAGVKVVARAHAGTRSGQPHWVFKLRVPSRATVGRTYRLPVRSRSGNTSVRVRVVR